MGFFAVAVAALGAPPPSASLLSLEAARMTPAQLALVAFCVGGALAGLGAAYLAFVNAGSPAFVTAAVGVVAALGYFLTMAFLELRETTEKNRIELEYAIDLQEAVIRQKKHPFAESPSSRRDRLELDFCRNNEQIRNLLPGHAETVLRDLATASIASFFLEFLRNPDSNEQWDLLLLPESNLFRRQLEGGKVDKGVFQRVAFDTIQGVSLRHRAYRIDVSLILETKTSNYQPGTEPPETPLLPNGHPRYVTYRMHVVVTTTVHALLAKHAQQSSYSDWRRHVRQSLEEWLAQ